MAIVKCKSITPLQAIRQYCLQCSCGDKKEVEKCVIGHCPLYQYRMGENNTNEQVKQVTPGDVLEEPKLVESSSEIEDMFIDEEPFVESRQSVEENPVEKKRKTTKKTSKKENQEIKQAINELEERGIATISKQKESTLEELNASLQKDMNEPIVQETTTKIVENLEKDKETPVEDESLDDIDLDDLFD